MSILSWIYGDDANAQAAADADAKLRELNRQQYGVDYVNTDNWVPPDQQNAQIDAAFGEGWNDGKKNVTGFVSGAFKVIGDGLSSVLLGIPAWVWLAAAAALWLYLGAPGLRKLKGKFA